MPDSGVGLSGTAPIAHTLGLLNVHDMTTDAAPGAVLPPPLTLVLAAAVTPFQRSVWPPPAVMPAVPLAATVSITSSPGALVAVTDAVALVTAADTYVPRGVTWSTPKKVTAPPTIRTVPVSVTTTLAVPCAGANRYHSALVVWAPFETEPIRVRLVPP